MSSELNRETVERTLAARLGALPATSPETALESRQAPANVRHGTTYWTEDHDTLERACERADYWHARSLVRATFAVVATSVGYSVRPLWAVSPADRLYSTGN